MKCVLISNLLRIHRRPLSFAFCLKETHERLHLGSDHHFERCLLSSSLPEIDAGRITIDDIEDAAAALNNIVTRTPLLENPDVNERLGGRLFIKAEHAQRSGAFKIRGAYNRLRFTSSVEKRKGVITYSSGNHGLGLALAARLIGTTAMIAMPSDCPAAKIEANKALGASVVTFERDSSTIDEVVLNLRNETGRIIVPPSGDVRSLAGTATAALELYQQVQETEARLDAVLVPCGGGGLTAATAFLMHELTPKTQVYAVEPELFDDTRRSLEAGRRVSNAKGQRTICDAIMTPTPNKHTFEINRKLLAGGLVASDDDVRTAIQFAFDMFKIIVEPGAAIGIAAVLNGQIDIKGKSIAVYTTGGNIDPARYCEFMTSANGLDDADR